jgi:formylmethanofuran--tetrahydromethanopterin N-formyltransferase
MTQCINGVEIEDTFAEAFGMWSARILITGANRKWAREAAAQIAGFATSVIACGCEAGIEGDVEQTPDGRPGVSVLIFAMGKDALVRQMITRIGQCVLTCPSTACFNGLPGEERVSIGGQLRFFGDGFQGSKVIGGRRYWRVPVMEGEFLVEDKFGVQRAIGGGNFLILGSHQAVTLEAAELAVEAMQRVPGVVMPFPGGIVRSGSKVGSKYKFLKASTNHAYCPSLRGIVASALPEGVHSVLEIVIDGLDVASIEQATRAGILAACIPGICRISAGNYGGNLGKFKFHLRKILDEVSPV